MKRLSLLCSMVVLLAATTASASIVDAPHNDTSGISCGSCHSYSLWWDYSPAEQDTKKGYATVINDVCAKCHYDQSPIAPYVLGHTSAILQSPYHESAVGAQDGWLNITCANCHDPHYQGTLGSVTPPVAGVSTGSYPTGLYLVTGTYTGTPTYNSGANTTTIGYEIAVGGAASGYDDVNPNWADPDSWVSKNALGRGAIITDGKFTNANSLIIKGATIDGLSACAVDDGSGINTIIDVNCTPGALATGTVTVKGNFSPTQGNSDSNTFGIIYGQLIRNAVIDKDNAEHFVDFWDPNGNVDAVSGNGGFVDTISDPGAGDDPTGVCQVCHTATIRFKNDGVMPADGHATANCTETCHTHDKGFKGAGHSLTYTGWNEGVDNCNVCHNPTAAALSIAAIHDNQCLDCHSTSSGGSANMKTNATVDVTNGVDAVIEGYTTTLDAGKIRITSTCTGCHSLAAGAASKTGSATIHHDSKNNLAATKKCTDCHQSALTAGMTGTLAADHSASLGVTQTVGTYPNETLFGCATCHQVDTSTTPSTDYRTHGSTDGAFVDADYTTLDNPRVHDSCTTCHHFDSAVATVGSLINAVDIEFRYNGAAGHLVENYAPGSGGIPDTDAPTDCFSCHGTTPGIIHLNHDHSMTVGNTPECNWCHSQQVGMLNGATTDVTNPMIHDDCTTCHIISKGIAGDFTIGLTSVQDRTRNLIDAIVTPIQKGSAVHCGDCHGIHLFKDHLHANHTTIVPGVSVAGCTDCHTGTYAYSVQGGAHPNPSGKDYGMPINATLDRTGDMVHDDCSGCHNYANGGLRTVAEVNAGRGYDIVVDMPNGLLDINSNNVYPYDGGGDCVACHGADYFDKHQHGSVGSKHQVVFNAGVDLAQSNSQGCFNCHDDAALGKGTGALGTWDAIKTEHATVNNVAQTSVCATCHDYATNGNQSGSADTPLLATVEGAIATHSATTCVTCHAPKAAPASHGGHSATDFGWAPATEASCGAASCHDSATNTDVVTYHVSFTDCGICHIDTNGGGPRTSGPNGNATLAASVAALCTDCHLDPTHISYNSHEGGHNVTAYEDTPTQELASETGVCATCHTDFLGSGRNFATISTAHVGLIITSADITGATDGTLNGTAIACTTCHQSGVAAVITTINSAKNSSINASCADCHGPRPAGHVLQNHNFSADGNCATCHTGADVVSNVHGGVCAICHTNPAGGDYTRRDGDPTNGIDGDARLALTPTATCSTCHVSAASSKTGAATVHHDSKSGYAAAGNCTQCHASGAGTLVADHSASVSLATDCSYCHSGAQGQASGMVVSAAATTHNACTSCHDVNGALISIATGMTSPNTCNDCHGTFATKHTTKDHAVRVSMTATCTDCHTGAAGTITGMPVSVATTTHNACASCHGTTGQLISIAAGQQGVGANACADCHGPFATKHAAVDHSTRVGMATDCSGCHAGAQGLAGGMVVSTDPKKHAACASCHGLTGGLTGSAATHTGNNTCNSCHGAFDTKHASETHVARVSLANDCSYCHAGAEGGVGGMVVSVANTTHNACASCHGTTGVLVSIATGKGATNSCNSCHGVFAAKHVAKDHAAQVSLTTECSYCHTNAAGLVGGMVIDSGDIMNHNACTSCHGSTGQLTSIAAARQGQAANACADCHGAFTTKHAAKPHAARVSMSIECDSCHTGAAGTLSGMPVSVATTTHNDCSSCHGTTGQLIGSAAPQQGVGTNACADCHDPVTKHVTNHFVAIQAGDTSQPTQEACSNCHGTALTDWTDVLSVHLTDCAKCHTANREVVDNVGASQVPAVFVADVIAAKANPTSCADCHLDKTIVTPHGFNHTTGGVMSALSRCTSCHTENILTGIHSTNGCTTCHSTTTAPIGAGDLIGSAVGHGRSAAGFDAVSNPNTCGTCHPNHAANFQTGHAGPVNHVAKGFVVKTSNNTCDDCHTAADTINDAKMHNGVCANCHTDNAGGIDDGVLRGVAAGKLNGGDCVTCHTTTWKSIHEAATPGIAHDASVSLANSCSYCHAGAEGTATGMTVSVAATTHNACTSCHGVNGDLISIAIGNTSPNSCTTCHGSFASKHASKDHAARVSLATDCSGCHTNAAGSASGIPVDTGNTKNHNTCASCHGSTGQLTGSAAARQGQAANTCNDCHGVFETKHAAKGHASSVSLATDCSYCHTGAQGLAGGIVVSTATTTHDACSSCHGTTGTLVSIAAGKGATNNCDTCHGVFATKHASKDHAVRVSLTTECSNCHTNAAGTVTGIPVSAGDTKNHNTCASCHGTTGQLVSIASSRQGVGASACADCHGDFATKHATVNHATRVSLATDCSGCHTGSAGTLTGMIVSTDPKTHATCASCHGTTGALTGSAATHTGNNTCNSCHGSFDTKHANKDHAARVSLATDCSYCHTGAEGAAGGMVVSGAATTHNTCSSCHGSTGTLVSIAAGKGAAYAITSN